MQRDVYDRFRAERRLGLAYPYGVVDAQLSGDALENMTIQFDQLRAVMPSGLEINVPETTHLSALNVEKAFKAGQGSLVINLAVPLWNANRPNSLEPSEDGALRSKRLFRVWESQRLDENTGENLQPVLLRQLNAFLLLESDDQTDMEVLPLLRITRATGEGDGLPRQDPKYVPACLVLRGSSMLRQLVRDLASQVEATRKEVVAQLTRAGFSVETLRGPQFEMILRLKTLNRFAGRLPTLAESPAVTPLEMYLELRDLLGELAALHPDRDEFEVQPYDHDNPAIAFRELDRKIRAQLRGLPSATYFKEPFKPSDRLLLAELTGEHVTQPNEYFLGVRTRIDRGSLTQLVENPDQFKLMARSMARHRVYGIKLAWEPSPPVELPAETGLHYYRLLRSESTRMWDLITKEKAMTILWPDMETSDLKITLYMTVPMGREVEP